MQRTLDAILKRFVCVGQLTVRWPNGERSIYAGPPDSGPAAGIVIEDARTIRRLVLNPTLAVGEAYMDRGLVPDGCGIYDVIEVLALNVMANAKGHPIARLRSALGVIRRRIDQYNPAYRARRNVAHHYDLNGRLYSLFLDRDRQYSCAYFTNPNATLEEAQVAKKRHIAAKLCLDRPDLTVLDIGCGWGGLALTLARDHGARVTGITLSTEQLNEARARAAAEGLTDRVSFELLDYRAMDRTFDRVVSVGMFEHVGVVHYREFFDTIGRCLNPDGVALLHAIGRSDGPGFTNPWIAKYIFPGGYCPALSEVVPRVEKSGLVATDIEILRLHYAETLRNWRRRFIANRDTIAAIYDERFCRMFEFYLCGSEIAFRREGHMVFQIQLAHQQTAVPLMREYIIETERRVARARANA
jgi:cyclopropane-fatty-acyl-phospholipid synthase